MRIPSFILSLNGPAKENEGEVLAASLRWSGSFQFAFDVDWNKNLRLLTGMNPLGSQYNLERGGTFTTPAILYTYSKQGKGEASRRFQRWAMANAIRDAEKDRPVLLNNWEATHCDFDEDRLKQLFDGARQVGAELFLLDDGGSVMDLTPVMMTSTVWEIGTLLPRSYPKVCHILPRMH